MAQLGETQYQMVFCDIDGTLIDSTYQMSSETVKKIQELNKMGVPFILVSARMPSGIKPLQKVLDIQQPMVCYSGALILNHNGDCIFSTEIPRDLGKEVEKYIDIHWPKVICSQMSHQKWKTKDIHHPLIVQEKNITGSQVSQGFLSDEGEDFDTGIHKFLCMGEAVEIANLSQSLTSVFPELSIYPSKDTYLEIMDGRVSKAEAIRFLCSRYGIPVERTVSFGDNYNDVDMLKVTGYSFAMGNAPDLVKKEAIAVTQDNDNQGVLKGLQQLKFASVAKK